MNSTAPTARIIGPLDGSDLTLAAPNSAVVQPNEVSLVAGISAADVDADATITLCPVESGRLSVANITSADSDCIDTICAVPEGT